MMKFLDKLKMEKVTQHLPGMEKEPPFQIEIVRTPFQVQQLCLIIWH
ncbi:hypothetical protein ES705_47532 [subsurface metagenome]